jgi:hypothetical protein
MYNLKQCNMSDILIKNEQGTEPLAVAKSDDPIDSVDLHVTDLEPTARIIVGHQYIVGLDNNTHMTGRTCTALDANAATATFTNH